MYQFVPTVRFVLREAPRKVKSKRPMHCRTKVIDRSLRVESVERVFGNCGLSGRRRSIPGVPIGKVELDAKVRAIANQLFREMDNPGHEPSGFDRLVTVAGRSMINIKFDANSRSAVDCETQSDSAPK